MTPRIAALALAGTLAGSLAATLVVPRAGVALASPGPTAKAASHYKLGGQFLAQGLWAQALAEYQTAYEIDPKPLLHYHMARAEQGAGHRQEAIDLYRSYLDEEPNGKGANDARKQVALLVKDLVDHPPEPPPAPEPPTPTPEPTTTATAQPILTPLPATPPPPAPHHHTDWRFVGAGAALVIAGVLLDALPKSASNKKLDPLDFAPVVGYAGGATLVFVGVF